MAEHMSQFLHNIDVLFVHGGVWGYAHTERTLAHLCRERAYHSPDGLVILGGDNCVTPEIRTRCLQRMAIWVKLTGTRMQAEFPEFQVLQALHVFDVKSCGQTSTDKACVVEARKKSLQRLSQVFGVPFEPLKKQFEFCYYAASHLMQNGQASTNMQAWIDTRRKLDDARMRRKHDMGAVDVVLQRYLASRLHCLAAGQLSRGFKTMMYIQKRLCICGCIPDN